MKTLLSKIQYYYYEKGEFSDIESRSLEDTLLLIHTFPWKEQRNEIFINLNGPSVTIENGSGAFLKLGIDYNGKFILYYLNERNHIFCKTGEILSEFDETVRDFFGTGIKEGALNKYRDWIFKKRKYFITNNFEYRIGLRRIIQTIFFPILGIILFITLFIFDFKNVKISGVAVALVFYLIFSITNWFLFFNYYFFSKNLYLKISNGNDEFFFGKHKKVKKYNKQEIKKVLSYQNQKWSKCPWGHFHTYEIQFNDGTSIAFTSLLISWFKFEYKFPDHFVHDKHRSLPKI